MTSRPIPLAVLPLLLIASHFGAACDDAADVCAAGKEGCSCSAASTCDPGLVCDASSGGCVRPRTLSLPAIDAAARSCELLLSDDGSRVVRPRAEGSVRVEHVREAPRTAIAFHATSDAPIGRDAVRVEVLGDGDFRIVNAQCFDRDGEPIEGGGIATDG